MLEPASDFRATYTYNNFMFLLSACVAERLGGGGATFEELVRDRILEPLGMDSSVFISELDDLGGLPVAYIYNDTADRALPLDHVLLRWIT